MPGSDGLPLELAVVLPTYNERDNVAAMVARLDAALAGVGWEAIFVDDDSSDGTAGEVRRLAAADRRVRVIQRIGRRGLASARSRSRAPPRRTSIARRARSSP